MSNLLLLWIGDEATIFIAKSNRKDNGIYQLTASNTLGSKTVRVSVTVIGEL